jgi:hypothetical protein
MQAAVTRGGALARWRHRLGTAMTAERMRWGFRKRLDFAGPYFVIEAGFSHLSTANDFSMYTVKDGE